MPEGLSQRQRQHGAGGQASGESEQNATFGLGFLSQDSPVVQLLIFGLALLSGCGVVGGVCLLLRVII